MSEQDTEGAHGLASPNAVKCFVCRVAKLSKVKSEKMTMVIKLPVFFFQHTTRSTAGAHTPSHTKGTHNARR